MRNSIEAKGRTNFLTYIVNLSLLVYKIRIVRREICSFEKIKQGW